MYIFNIIIAYYLLLLLSYHCAARLEINRELIVGRERRRITFEIILLDTSLFSVLEITTTSFCTHETG